jgi:endonuclease/exonuclease/phosphatase family metal-dependent hydrolase
VKLFVKIVKIIALMTILFFGVVYFVNFHPSKKQEEKIVTLSKAPSLKKGQKIKILSWNVQFLAGNQNNNFFFDNGEDLWPSKKTILKVRNEVVRVILEEDPDIILFQELDDGAKRTYSDDQLQLILKKLPKWYRNHTSTFYWKSHFVPHPKIMGKVGMKLSVVSKYKMTKAIRHRLSAITNQNFIIQQFNPKRALLDVTFPVQNGKDLHIVNGHLSAFAQGSDTMKRQVSSIYQIMKKLTDRDTPVVVGGDFNLIPPGIHYNILSEKNKKKFNSKGSEIKPLFDEFGTVPTYKELNRIAYRKWFTAMGTQLKNKSPDKTIDYILFNKKLSLGKHYIRSLDTVLISDHLPVIATLTIQ